MIRQAGRTAVLGALVRPFHIVRWLLAVALCAALAACGGGGGGSSPPPAVAITGQPPDVHVTAGASASFTVVASGSVSYEWQRLESTTSTWSDVAGGGGAILSLGAVGDADNGAKFRVIVASRANPSNSVSSSIVTLTVDPRVIAPVIVAAPADATVVEGMAVTFSVTATGTAPAYQWQRSPDGSAWSDVGGATLTNVNLVTSLADDGAWLRVQVSNAKGSVTSTPARLHVTELVEAPQFTTQPSSTTVTVGQSATFNAVATGMPAPDLQWMTSADGVNWVAIAGATSGSYTTPATTLADDGHWFRATATNASSTDSVPVRLTVHPVVAAPVITLQPADLTSQSTTVFQVAATGYPSPTYQWQISRDAGASFTNINDATLPTYFYSTTLTAADDGMQFRAVVSNPAGSVTSRAATVTVVTNPMVQMDQREAVWRAGVSSLPLVANATGGHLHYAWRLVAGTYTNPQEISVGTDAPSYDLPASAPGDTHEVCVTVTNVAGSFGDCTVLTNLRWTAVAPQPTLETLRAAAWVDANTALAGGAVGTILRSTDGGASWSEVFNDGNVTRLTRGIATRGTLALAVGEQGFDARSTNGGQDWRYVSTLDNTFWNAVAFTDAGRAVKVGGMSGAVVRTSSDQGLTWQDASVAAGAEVLSSLAINHADVALAAGLNGVVARSTDGGLTWTAQHIGSHNLNAVAFASDTVAVAAGDYGLAWRSVDGGQTWTPASSATAYAITDIHFASATVGVAATLQGPPLRTSDGGQTWVLSGTDPGYASFSARFGPDGHTVLAVGGTGGILRSTDAGLNYGVPVPHATFATNLAGVAFNAAGVGLAVGNTGVLRSTDGGATWSAVVGSGAGLLGVAFVNPATAVAVGVNGLILRSTDTGATWTSRPSPTTDQIEGVAFSGSGVGVAATPSGLLRSADGGLTWSAVAGVPGIFNALTSVAANTFVAVTAGGTVHRSTDGGLSWILVATRVGGWNGVACADASTLVAVGSDNIGHALALRSVDGGATWTDAGIAGFANYFGAVAFASTTKGVAVGSNGTLYRTLDGGASWIDDFPIDDAFLRGVAIVQGRAVAVGWYGAIVRSDAL